MAWSDPRLVLAAAQGILRRRRAAAIVAAIAAALALAALALIGADAAFALGERARRLGGWAWLAAAPVALAALVLRWRALAPREGSVRAVERACDDRDRTLAQALDLAAQPGELAAAATAQLLGRLPLAELPRRLPRGGLRLAAGVFAATAAVAALGWLVAPDLARTGWLRWTDPAGDHPPWSQTRLGWGEAPASVRSGHAARIEVVAEGRPCAAPVLVLGNAGGEARIAMFPVAPGRWAAEIARVTTPLTLWAEGGGTATTRRHLALDPVPELTWIDLRLEQPAYAALPPTDRRLSGGAQAQFEALAGATLRLVPAANRPLAALHRSLDTGAWQRFPLVDGALNLPATSGAWRIRLEASDGAQGEDIPLAGISLRPDLPPRVDFVAPAREAFATPDSVVPYAAHGEDDLGLAAAERFRQVGGLDVPTAPDRPSGRTWEWRGQLDLAELGAEPGDVIGLGAVIRDTDPAIGPDGRPGKASAVAARHIRVVGWDEYNETLRRRLDVNALENKYRPLLDELRELQRQARELAQAPKSDDLQPRMDALRRKAAALAAKVEAMRRPDPLFRVEPELQKALAEAAKALAEGRDPAWDAEAMARDLAEMTRRARAADLARRLAQLADAEQNTTSRILPLAGHRKPSDGELLRLAELGSDEEQLAKALDEWRALARAWANREKAELPREAARLLELADAVDDGDISGLKRRAAAAARAGDGREAHRLAAEARDLLLALLPKAERAGASAAGGGALGMGWCGNLGDDLGGLLGAGGGWGVGGSGDGGTGAWLGYGGDDRGGTNQGATSDLYGPENLGGLGAEGKGDNADPVADLAASGNRAGFAAAARRTATARTTGAARSSLAPAERKVVDDYFRRLEADP